MNFLKNLFSGGGSPSQRLVVYVQPRMCKEILRVDIDLLNSPSQAEDGKGYYLRKLARGVRCPFEVEMEFFLNGNRQLVDKTITNGEFVDEATYLAFIDEQKSDA